MDQYKEVKFIMSQDNTPRNQLIQIYNNNLESGKGNSELEQIYFN